MCIPQVLRAGCSSFNHLDLSNCNKKNTLQKLPSLPLKQETLTLKPTPLPYEIFDADLKQPLHFL